MPQRGQRFGRAARRYQEIVGELRLRLDGSLATIAANLRGPFARHSSRREHRRLALRNKRRRHISLVRRNKERRRNPPAGRSREWRHNLHAHSSRRHRAGYRRSRTPGVHSRRRREEVRSRPEAGSRRKRGARSSRMPAPHSHSHAHPQAAARELLNAKIASTRAALMKIRLGILSSPTRFTASHPLYK